MTSIKERLGEHWEMERGDDLLRHLIRLTHDTLEVEKRQEETLNEILKTVTPPQPTSTDQAVKATFIIHQGDILATFTVDETTGTGVVGFEDDKGDTDAPQPAGSTVAFTSDNPSVVSVAADATNPLQADLTVEGVEGSANITASVNDANGNPITEADDGTTAFTQPAPVAVTVSAGQAVSGEFSVASGAAA